MKFPDIEISNFLAITEARVQLADRGLVLVQGANSVNTAAGSNGAGKSSLVDALSWCLYGVTARGVTGDDVVNRSAGKGTRVAVRVQDGTGTYTVTRHRKHKTGKNTLTVVHDDGLGRETVLTKGTDKLTQDVVTKLIGASLEVFNGAIYAGQEQMPDLPAMTDKHLKLLIEEAAGVTVLEEAYELARKGLLALQQELAQLDADLVRLGERRKWVEDQSALTTQRAKDWAEARDAELARMKLEIANHIAPALKKAMDEVAAVDITAIETGLGDCDAKLAGVNATMAELHRLQFEEARAQSALASAEATVKRALGVAKMMEDALGAVTHKLGCPCTECGRPLTEAELEAATLAARQRHHDAGEALASACVDEEHAKEALQRAADARLAQEQSMPDLSAVASQRSALSVRRDAYHALLRTRDLARDRAVQIKGQIETKTAETCPHDPAIYAVQIKESDAAIAEAKAKRDACAERLAVETEVVAVFGPAGVRARILDEVTPFLNAQTSKYLATLSDSNISATWSTLTPDSKGNLKEKFAIDVTSLSDASLFKGLSGGEKRKVRVSTALALQDLVATRASKPIELFIADEIDDALDPAGIERLGMILEEKGRERGSVFVISHNDLKDVIPTVLTIEKTATGTVLTETRH